jgi:peptidoglycan-associated lipoprotein
MMLRATALILAGTFVLATGCAKKSAVNEAVPTTSARVQRPNVNVSDDLAKLCHIKFNDAERAPKFDFDEAALLPEDRDVLDQIAKCVTTGPLKGRKLALVGRADPRGEMEYNMVLGEYRADTVRMYLAKLGVDEERISQTSRGELDAQGTDEDTWKRDRRVDIMLP